MNYKLFVLIMLFYCPNLQTGKLQNMVFHKDQF